MSNPQSTISDREKAQELVDLLVSDKKPSGPVRKEIMLLASEIVMTLPKEKQQKIRAALSILSDEVSTETPPEVRELFSGTESELMQAAPDIANTIMEERFKLWKGSPLEKEQKTNIKLAVISRIAEGNFASNIIKKVEGGMSALSTGLKDIFKAGKIEEIAKNLLSGSKDVQGASSVESTITREVMNMVDAGLSEIQKAHEANPVPPGYLELLKHPKLLAEYSFGADISELLRKGGSGPDERKVFSDMIRSKLTKIDKNITSMEHKKENIFDVLAKIPDIGSNTIIESMKWLFSIPIFGAFARGFLGIQGNDDPIETLKRETNERRVIGALKDYGITGKFRGEIPLISDIDFSQLSYSQLRPFMRKMRESSVELTGDFWKKVFLEGKISYEKNGAPASLKFPQWQKGKETLPTILSKLNNSPTPPTTMTSQSPTSPTQEATGSRPQETDRGSLLKKGLLDAKNIPFRAGNEQVSFESGELIVGATRYKLEGVGVLTVAIQSLSIQGDTIILGHRFGKSEVSKGDVIDAIPELLALKPGEVTNVKGDEGTLKITRSA